MEHNPNKYAWKDTPRAHEAKVRREVSKLDGFDFLDAVSAILAEAIDRAGERSSHIEANPRRQAVMIASIRAFRAIRSASAVIASGYPMEAEPFTRLLLELFVSAQAAVEDETGEEAIAWLQGKRARGIGKRTRDALPDGSLYGSLSNAVHGDPRAVLRALGREEAGQLAIEWGPTVTTQTDEQLRHLALAARDFSVLTEQVGFGEVKGIEEVDHALQSLVPGWRPDR